MEPMNNWLAFSLSPQELPSQPVDHQDHQSQTTISRLGFNSDEISGTDMSGECFDLTSDSSAHSLNLPPPFGILEAFNRNSQSQGLVCVASSKHTHFYIFLSCQKLNMQNPNPSLLFFNHISKVWFFFFSCRLEYEGFRNELRWKLQDKLRAFHVDGEFMQ